MRVFPSFYWSNLQTCCFYITQMKLWGLSDCSLLLYEETGRAGANRFHFRRNSATQHIGISDIINVTQLLVLLFTCSRPAPGSWQLKERCSSPEAAYRGFSPGQLSCSTSGLYDRTDLNGSMVYTERLENQKFNCYVTPVNQQRILTYLCEHLEQVGQSSLLLLQDVLHLSLLLLFLCWHVDGEALQVSQVADDLTWQEQQQKKDTILPLQFLQLCDK